MDTVEITLRLPADFVNDAEEFGLLKPEKVEEILREELDRAVMDLVNAEIKAYRKEKRAAQNSLHH
ncbi:MAG: hypothetical protein IAE89_08210 [Anaerolineae bacterium]|nr:hypothetical protein [Anaerolineae bacterium]